MRMCRSLIREFCRRDLQRSGSLVELWVGGGESLGSSWIGPSGLGPNRLLGTGFRWDSDALRTLLGELASVLLFLMYLFVTMRVGAAFIRQRSKQDV